MVALSYGRATDTLINMKNFVEFNR
jgi:hypothetical protein